MGDAPQFTSLKPPPALLMNCSEQTRLTREKTVIVLGCSRGGTSAVAGAIQSFGIPMSDERLRDGHYETPLLKTYFDPAAGLPLEFGQYIETMNNRHPIWGWKAFADENNLAAFGRCIRNPHVVAVFRDFVALTQRRLDTGEHKRAPWPRAVYAEMREEIAHLLSLVEVLPWPTLLVSFERLKTTPDLVIRQIAEFLGLDITDEALNAAACTVSPIGGYLIQARPEEAQDSHGDSPCQPSPLP